MTIPESTIRRAAMAAWESLPPAGYGTWESLLLAIQQDHVDFLTAALPILRDAIRAELVQEMIYSLHGTTIEEAQAKWLRSFLPESEPQP